jgi:hypothetical protein
MPPKTYRSNNVSSQNTVSGFVSQNLHKAICLVVCLGSAVGSKREFSNLVFNALWNKLVKKILATCST